MQPRTRHLVEVRPWQPADGKFLAGCEWVAVDACKRKFGGRTEEEARLLAVEYLTGRTGVTRQLQFDM